MSHTSSDLYRNCRVDWANFIRRSLHLDGTNFTNLKLVIYKAGQVGIAVLGQFRLDSESMEEIEGQPPFALSACIAIDSAMCCKSILSLIQKLPAAETQFAGSKPLIAFKIEYFENLLPAGSNAHDAILDLNKSYHEKNMSLQRIPNSWVSFNALEGLKFCHSGFEIRVHSPENSLLEKQKKELETISNKALKIKIRQLKLQQKLEEARRNKNASQIETFSGQLKSVDAELKPVGASFQATLDQNNSNAAIHPVLRGIYESQLDQAGLKQHAVQMLFAIKALARQYLLNARVLQNCHNTPLEKSKIRFLEKALSSISPHLPSIEPAPEPDSGDMPNYMQELKDLLAYRVNFLALNASNQNATKWISDQQHALLDNLQQKVDELEQKLDGHVENRLDTLCRKDFNKHGEMAVLMMLERAEVLDEALEEKGLLEINSGVKSYVTPLEYDQQRTMFDQQLNILLCSLLLNLLCDKELDSENPLHVKLLEVTNVSIMQEHPFYTCLNDDLKKIVSDYAGEIDQLKNAWHELWKETAIDKMNAARTNALSLEAFRKKLVEEKEKLSSNPNATFPSSIPNELKPDIKAYKQAKKTPTKGNLLRTAAIGHKHRSVDAWFEEQAFQGLDLMISIIDSLGSLTARRYLCQKNHSIVPIKHFFWKGATYMDDPHYKANETHIPILNV